MAWFLFGNQVIFIDFILIFAYNTNNLKCSITPIVLNLQLL